MMIDPSSFTIKMRGGQEMFRPYYFFRRLSIRGAEVPMTKKSQEEYSSSLLLKDARLVSSLYEVLTIRVYTDLSNTEAFVDFDNQITVKRSNNQILDIHLAPQKNFFRLETTTFIGTYNPFIIEGGSQKLENYFIGYALGLTHQILKLNSYYFEIIPILYAPIDIEMLKDQIADNKVPFVGFKSIEMC
jgi:hypothetical protein